MIKLITLFLIKFVGVSLWCTLANSGKGNHPAVTKSFITKNIISEMFELVKRMERCECDILRLLIHQD